MNILFFDLTRGGLGFIVEEEVGVNSFKKAFPLDRDSFNKINSKTFTLQAMSGMRDDELYIVADGVKVPAKTTVRDLVLKCKYTKIIDKKNILKLFPSSKYSVFEDDRVFGNFRLGVIDL